MSNPSRSHSAGSESLPKCPTGIHGLDEVTQGGLPKARTTLLCGGPGSGKTLFGLEFLVRGAVDFGEPGVFVAFEETAAELSQNVISVGFDLAGLSAEKKLLVDNVRVQRNEIEETGAYDLDGLFVRLGHAIDSIGAKRVVLDTIEALFSALTDVGILRSELRRLFRWLNDRGVTTIVTAEKGDGSLTRHGLEEYVSDCVIALDHRVSDQVATRRLRIIKYRGTVHGTNEYPFLIDEKGLTVVPITAISLQYKVSSETISTGIKKLDEMFSAGGFYRGSTLMVSGTAGSGKSSILSAMSEASCLRGEKCVYFSFEESPDQLIRNMRSVGVDLKNWVDSGLLRIEAIRPPSHGLDTHLATMQRTVEEFSPRMVVFDPVSSFDLAGDLSSTRSMLNCLIDYLKLRQITAVFSSLTPAGQSPEQTEVGISSLVDVWLLVRNVEQRGEHTRTLYIRKARGLAHSNRVREFLLTDQGLEQGDVYVGGEGIVVGAARAYQEAEDRARELALRQELESRQHLLERKRLALSAQIAQLEAEFEADQLETEQYMASLQAGAVAVKRERRFIADGRVFSE